MFSRKKLRSSLFLFLSLPILPFFWCASFLCLSFFEKKRLSTSRVPCMCTSARELILGFPGSMRFGCALGPEASPRLRGVAQAIISLSWPLARRWRRRMREREREKEAERRTHGRAIHFAEQDVPRSPGARAREEHARKGETTRNGGSHCNAPPNELALFCSGAGMRPLHATV